MFDVCESGGDGGWGGLFGRVEGFVRDRAGLWQVRMGLGHWDVDHVFLESFFVEEGFEDVRVCAVTESRWEYLSARVRWFLPAVVRLGEVEVDKILVHELCHVMLSPEQVLIDARLSGNAAHERLTNQEHALLADRNYEHLELATEMTCRAIWTAWEDWESIAGENTE